MFSPVLLKVPGQMTRSPCGFGAYDTPDRPVDNHNSASWSSLWTSFIHRSDK